MADGRNRRVDDPVELRYLEKTTDDLQAQMDRRIETQEREREDQRRYFERLIGENDRRYTELREADLRALAVADANAQHAIETAKTEASERLTSHNGLIDKMEKQASLFALREVVDPRIGRLEQWQAKLTGMGVVLAVIGVGNLVKLWLS
jgi:regulator of protease activity HflC (stomatin/prohibitin superfamily)